MKQYKELRFTGIIVVMALLLDIISMWLLMVGEVKRGLIGLIIVAFAFFLVSRRYNIILDSESLTVFEWKVIMMLPVIINYEDIKFLKTEGKHKVIVDFRDTKKERTIKFYVYDNSEIERDFKQLRSAYRKNKKLK